MNKEPNSNSSGGSPWLRNWIGLGGVIIIAGSVFSFVLLMFMDLFAARQNPYLGILTWVVAPAFFFLGLFVMVIGRFWSQSSPAKDLVGQVLRPRVIDLSSRQHRKYLVVFAVIGVVFMLLSAIGSYQTYRATSSVQFCGQACHQPMEPQFVAYQHSPHAKVECTHCHIGPGAANFVKAKFNGVHQLLATARDKYEKPIHLSGKIDINQKTCEQCHWPDRYVGNLERAYHHYLADESNTTYSVRLLLKVGGSDATHGPPGGIHWHMNLANKIEYVATDKGHQNIPWVRMTNPDGKVTEFRRPDFKDDPAQYAVRSMDCMDCHNRPAHQFRTPNDAVDLAIHLGKISTNLPMIKKVAVNALVSPVETKAEGLAKVAAEMRKAYPNHKDLEPAIAAIQDIYRRDFFPELKTDWRAHPDNIGHKDWPGCFRCHDGQHKTADGKRTLGASDCNSCHVILAQGSGEELQKLSSAGHNFFHVDAPYSDFDCNKCHTGTAPKE